MGQRKKLRGRKEGRRNQRQKEKQRRAWKRGGKNEDVEKGEDEEEGRKKWIKARVRTGGLKRGRSVGFNYSQTSKFDRLKMQSVHVAAFYTFSLNAPASV